ncbi:MAG: hypothetical protein K0S29_542 [Gammaproteobacteria bacterium]|nr:hypothetical protein [Gammaproteobacteria bacterium]
MQQIIVLLGFIAILQMLFIPGYLLLRAFRISVPVLRGFLLSFALSFLCNYILVALLSILHIYNSFVVWAVVGVEAIAFLKLMWPNQSSWDSWRMQIKLCQKFWQSLEQGTAIERFIRLSLLFAAIFIIVFFINLFFQELGEIFTAWDPVMSYNVWAEQWASGHLPQYTWHYPQLIPANWSITYVMTEVASNAVNLEFFAKAVMPLFPIMLLLVLLDLAIETRRSGYLLAIVFTTYLLSRFAESFGQGWVDVPMCFFGFLSISLLFLAGRSQQPLRYIAFSSLACAASAVTKQAGLYILVWYPVLCYVLALKQQDGSLKKLLPIFWSWALAMLISLPWYIYIQYQIDHGLASSEVGFVTSNIYQVLGFDWGIRIGFGVFEAGIIFWLLLALALTYACLYRSPWRILALFIVPFSLIWIAFYSYALRNFTLISPFLGLLAGLACEKFYVKGTFKRLLDKLKACLCLLDAKPLHIVLGLLSVVFITSLIPQCSDPALIQAQTNQQELLGDGSLNQMLFRYKAEHGLKGKIITSWDYLGHIPGLSQYYQPYRPVNVEANPYQSSWMVNPKELPGILANYPAKYILVATEGGLSSAAYLHYFKQLEQQHVIKAVIELPNFTLYEIEQNL